MPTGSLPDVSVGSVSVGLGLRRLRPFAGCRLLLDRLVGLADLREHEHRGHLRDEEDAADREEEPEAIPRKPGPRPWNDERRDEREDDEGEGDDRERDLVAGQRQQHGEDATTVLGDEIRLLLERRHGQAEVLQLRPVELRSLLLARPDERLTRRRRCASRALIPWS